MNISGKHFSLITSLKTTEHASQSNPCMLKFISSILIEHLGDTVSGKESKAVNS